MSIIVTGGTGFIGLNLIEVMLEKGLDVVSFSMEDPPNAFLEHVEHYQGRLTSVTGDVRDLAHLKAVMADNRATGLFPLAAVTADASRETSNPESLFSVNVDGLITQLRAARDVGVKRIVVPASGAIYGDSYFDRAVVDEATTPCEPRDLYGITKFAAERVALRLGNLWKLNLVVARIGGTFGPWERPTGVRDLITPFYYVAQLAHRGEEAVFPYDIPDYCWVYSKDIASGLWHLYEEANSGSAFNISSGLNWGHGILEFAQELALVYPEFTWRQSADQSEVNVPFTDYRSRARMNISRIGASGWRPSFMPKAAFRDYAAWVSRFGKEVLA
jgi:nucleoside-diphosphate-sugar epimerase